MPVKGTRPEYNRRDYRRATAKIVAGHFKCVRCGKPADTANHKKRVGKGGTLKSGLEPMCRACNSAEGGRAS